MFVFSYGWTKKWLFMSSQSVSHVLLSLVGVVTQQSVLFVFVLPVAVGNDRFFIPRSRLLFFIGCRFCVPVLVISDCVVGVVMLDEVCVEDVFRCVVACGGGEVGKVLSLLLVAIA